MELDQDKEMVIEIDGKPDEHTFEYSSETMVPVEKCYLIFETFKKFFAALNMTD